MHEKQKQKLSDALQALTYSDRSVGVGLAYGERLAPRCVIADKTRDGQTIDTAAVSRDGVIWNPDFVESQGLAEIVFTIFHETLHEALDHHGLARELGLIGRDDKIIPGKERDLGIFAEAADKLINAIAKRDQIGKLVAGILELDKDYDGPLDTRAIYYWLKARADEQQDEQDESGGQGGEDESGEGKPDPRLKAPGTGCLPTGRPGASNEDGGEDESGEGPGNGKPRPGELSDAEREMMRATIAQKAGTGTALAEAVCPKVKRSGWREMLRNAAQTVSMDASDRSRPSYARGSRREPIDSGIILPGYIGTEATLCVVLDVSGSMDDYKEAIASECLAIARDFPRVRVRLIAHTSAVVYDAWMKPGGDASAIGEATAKTGGTCVGPAYDAARAVRARWDALVHFTDAEVENPWPSAPARRLFVGVTGEAGVTGKLWSTPPAGAKVVPVREG